MFHVKLNKVKQATKQHGATYQQYREQAKSLFKNKNRRMSATENVLKQKEQQKKILKKDFKVYYTMSKLSWLITATVLTTLIFFVCAYITTSTTAFANLEIFLRTYYIILTFSYQDSLYQKLCCCCVRFQVYRLGPTTGFDYSVMNKITFMIKKFEKDLLAQNGGLLGEEIDLKAMELSFNKSKSSDDGKTDNTSGNNNNNSNNKNDSATSPKGRHRKTSTIEKIEEGDEDSVDSRGSMEVSQDLSTSSQSRPLKHNNNNNKERTDGSRYDNYQSKLGSIATTVTTGNGLSPETELEKRNVNGNGNQLGVAMFGDTVSGSFTNTATGTATSGSGSGSGVASASTTGRSGNMGQFSGFTNTPQSGQSGKIIFVENGNDDDDSNVNNGIGNSNSNNNDKVIIDAMSPEKIASAFVNSNQEAYD